MQLKLELPWLDMVRIGTSATWRMVLSVGVISRRAPGPRTKNGTRVQGEASVVPRSLDERALVRCPGEGVRSYSGLSLLLL